MSLENIILLDVRVTIEGRYDRMLIYAFKFERKSIPLRFIAMRIKQFFNSVFHITYSVR